MAFVQFVAKAVLLSALCCMFALDRSNAQAFTMKLSSPTINDVTHEYYMALKAGIEKASKGRIKVEIYPASQLGQLPAVVEGVALGTIEVGTAANGFWVGLEPRFQIFEMPGLFDDVAHGYRVVTDPEIRARLATFGSAKGIEILAPSVYAPLMVLSHKPVRAVADLKGQKIRTPGGAPIQIEPFKKLGVFPVSIPLGEALSAIQNRTIDGMVAAASPFVSFKYYDITKAMTYLPATTLVTPTVISRSFLKTIGPELEAIVRDEARKAETVFLDWNLANVKQVEETWRKNGGEIIMLPPAEASRYLEIVVPAATAMLKSNPKLGDDYEAFRSAAEKYRK